MIEIPSRKEWEARMAFHDEHRIVNEHAECHATIEALAEALNLIEENDSWVLSREARQSLANLREKGWIE